MKAMAQIFYYILIVILAVVINNVKVESNKNEALLQLQIDTIEKSYQTCEIKFNELSERTEKDRIDRSDERGERRIMEVTAYDLSFQSCNKHPNHPEYGITASGKHVTEWQTVAAWTDIPFGTKVYVPHFKDKPNKGIFTVEDRGGAIKEGMLDVYMADYDECMEFGREKEA